MVTVNVELTPALVGVMLAGPGVQVGPDGCPVHVRETAPLKPFAAVPVMLNVPELPASIVKLPGFAFRAKSGVDEARTVSAGCIVNSSPPDVPNALVTVNV